MNSHSAIQANAHRLKELHESLHETVEGEAERTTRITQYLERYELLAFPGGLSRAMVMLAAGEPATVETAIDFLEVDPHFHRSGYIKADLLRFLKRAELDEAQKERLRRVVLARVSGQDSREFRSYCRISTVLDTGWFRDALKAQSEDQDRSIKRRAGWVLRAMGPPR